MYLPYEQAEAEKMTPWVTLTRAITVTGRRIGGAVARNQARKKLRSEIFQASYERNSAVNDTLAELEVLRYDLRRRGSQ